MTDRYSEYNYYNNLKHIIIFHPVCFALCGINVINHTYHWLYIEPVTTSNMDRLCRELHNSTLSKPEVVTTLPEIRLSELQKDPETVTPVFTCDDIQYPTLTVADVIEVQKESGETLYYLIIQRTGEQYITYRLDKYKPKRYDCFENHNSIIALIEAHKTIIHRDPFNIKPENFTTNNTDTAGNIDLYKTGNHLS